MKRDLRVPESFPDTDTCRTKAGEVDDFFLCLNIWVGRCPYALFFNNENYCRHPDAPQMLKKPKAP